jgi:hypothetical protein
MPEENGTIKRGHATRVPEQTAMQGSRGGASGDGYSYHNSCRAVVLILQALTQPLNCANTLIADIPDSSNPLKTGNKSAELARRQTNNFRRIWKARVNLLGHHSLLGSKAAGRPIEARYEDNSLAWAWSRLSAVVRIHSHRCHLGRSPD